MQKNEIKQIYIDMREQIHNIAKFGRSDQLLADNFIWFSIGELICCCNDKKNSDGGYDLCDLYRKADGHKAEYKQIMARCRKYPHLFQLLPGNFVKLKEQ